MNIADFYHTLSQSSAFFNYRSLAVSRSVGDGLFAPQKSSDCRVLFRTKKSNLF